MTERLGFNDTLLLLALGGIGAFALGAVLGTGSPTQPTGIAAYIDQEDSDDRSNVAKLIATGKLLQQLGVIAFGAAVILAAVRAEGHSTVIRGIMLVVGVAVMFQMLSFGFNTSFGR